MLLATLASAGRCLARPAATLQARSMHAVTAVMTRNNIASCGINPSNQHPALLESSSVSVQQSAGMKHKVRLYRRCIACYFCFKGGVLHVKCPIHGRHNLMAKEPKATKTYILTDVNTKRKKPY